MEHNPSAHQHHYSPYSVLKTSVLTKKSPTAYQSSIRPKKLAPLARSVSGRPSHLVNFEHRRKLTTEPIIFTSDNLLSGVTVEYSLSIMQVHENISVDVQ
jgi:hypothetical protein